MGLAPVVREILASATRLLLRVGLMQARLLLLAPLGLGVALASVARLSVVAALITARSLSSGYFPGQNHGRYSFYS